MDSVPLVLEIAGFVGGAGVLVGYPAGRMAVAAQAGMAMAVLIGAGFGLLVGSLFALEIVREVESSDSSTAAIGLLLLPIPLFANLVTGAVIAMVVTGNARR